MVKKAAVYAFILIFAKTIYAQLNSNCRTPNGEPAICKSIFACPVITNAISSNQSRAIEFAQKSQCGWDQVALVCCGSTGVFIPIDIFSLFTTEKPKPTPASVQAVILEDFNVNTLPNRTTCGIEREGDKVFGGEITDISEYPWMAALKYNYTETGEDAGIRCGGSLINNRFVLTAAHCLFSIEFSLHQVWLGDWNLTSNPDCLTNTLNAVCNDPVLKLKVTETIPHAFFGDGNNDIALLKLEKDVTYTNYIRPICLPPANLPNPTINSRLTVSGWGITENGTSSNLKRKVEVPLVLPSKCRKVLQYRIISANHLCAGGEIGKDSCEGDSGGPLMRQYEDKLSNYPQWYLEGVVAYGSGCGYADAPAVYTRVTRYLNWIINNISE